MEEREVWGHMEKNLVELFGVFRFSFVVYSFYCCLLVFYMNLFFFLFWVKLVFFLFLVLFMSMFLFKFGHMFIHNYFLLHLIVMLYSEKQIFK